MTASQALELGLGRMPDVHSRSYSEMAASLNTCTVLSPFSLSLLPVSPPLEPSFYSSLLALSLLHHPGAANQSPISLSLTIPASRSSSASFVSLSQVAFLWSVTGQLSLMLEKNIKEIWSGAQSEWISLIMFARNLSLYLHFHYSYHSSQIILTSKIKIGRLVCL